MKNVKEAFLLAAHTPDSFNKELDRYLNQGWQPFGSVALSENYYGILMVKYVNEENPTSNS